MSKEKPNMLTQFLKFFQWEVTCECCGSRYEEGGPKDQTKEIIAMARLNQQNAILKEQETKSQQQKSKAIEKMGDNLFEQMVAPKVEIVKIEQAIPVKSSITKRKSKFGDIQINAEGKPKWTHEKEAHLRQFINTYGPNPQMAKEYFPSFDIKELSRRIKKIVQNKDDSIKAKIRNLIKKQIPLEEIVKTLSDIPSDKVIKFHDKIVFNTQKKKDAQDPQLLERIFGNCESDATKSTTLTQEEKNDAATYDDMALEEEETFDGYYREEPAESYDEFDFGRENLLNGMDDPFVFSNKESDSFTNEKYNGLFENNDFMNDNLESLSANNRKMTDLGIFGQQYEGENSNSQGFGNFDPMTGFYDQIRRYE